MNDLVRLGVLSLAAMALCAQPAGAIINGTLDTSYECVGSLHSSALGFHCTGTLIHESWVLTSAFCALSAPNLWAMGADWTASPRVYVIDHAAVHQSYDGAVFDFALLHLAWPAVDESVCALGLEPDNLYAGMPLTTVGYGLTSDPGGFTSQRHRAPGVVDTLEALRFFYFFGPGMAGPCYGDEGGPNISGTDLVVGVFSFSDCSTFASSGRVGPVFDWIVLTIVEWSGIFVDGFETGDTVLWSATSP